MQQSPSIFFLFNLGESIFETRAFFRPPTLCTTHFFRAGISRCNVWPPPHSLVHIFRLPPPPTPPVPSHTLLSPDWFISPIPSLPPTLFFQLNQGLTAPCCLKKNLPLYIPVQSGPAVSCPCLSCRGRPCHASEVKLCQQGWMIPKATGLCDNKTSMVYLFFIQINEISIFWLTTDNFHFRILFSGALMFFFSNYQWLLKQWYCWRIQGIVWSHTVLDISEEE